MTFKKNELLFAALRCGMWPLKDPIHRMLLFFVANAEFKSKAHFMTYQKTIETGVLNGVWQNHIKRGSGEYVLTEIGYQMAKDRFGIILPGFRAATAYQFEIGLGGMVSKIDVQLRRVVIYVGFVG